MSELHLWYDMRTGSADPVGAWVSWYLQDMLSWVKDGYTFTEPQRLALQQLQGAIHEEVNTQNPQETR